MINILTDITPVLQKSIKPMFSAPCVYDYRRFDQLLKSKRDYNDSIKAGDFDTVISILAELFDNRVANYDNGSLLYKNVFNILQSRKNANKTAQLFNVLAHFHFYEDNTYYVTKFYKQLSAQQKEQLNDICSEYLVFEFNKCLEEIYPCILTMNTKDKLKQ